jgi:methylated-DNA-[protein]-cysteine S-methyltransferase
MSHSLTNGSLLANLRSNAGPVLAEWREGKLVSLRLGDTGRPSKELPEDFKSFLVELERYLNGERIRFKVPFDLGTQPPFIGQALKECSKIPYGRTRSYAELAELTGNPRAARAVGQAMARNPIPIVVPCHRVLTSAGHLGGFGCGLDWKRFLLKLEDIPWKE